MVTLFSDKMNRNELEKDSNMQKWKTLLENFSISKNPKSYWTKCITAMMYYTEMTGKTPEKLIADAKSELGKPNDEKELTYLIPKFKKYLQDGKHIVHDNTGKRNELSANSIYLYVATIKSFYSYHYIDVPKIKSRNKRPKTKPENDKIPILDEIREFHSHCNVLEKALLLCAISGGLGAAELSSIKLRTFWDGYDPETEITTLRVTRPKTDVDFITFLNPEGSRAVIKYLNERDAEPLYDTPVYVKRAKRQHTTDDSYLFINCAVDDDFFVTHDEESRYLDPDLIRMRYRKVNKKAQKNTAKGKYNHIRAHTVRKIFSSTLKTKGCNNTLVEYLMGHTIDATQAAYFFKSDKITDEDIQQMKEEYMKYYPYLLVLKETPLTDEPEYKRAEVNIQNLKAENAKIKVERYEFRELNNKIDYFISELIANEKIDNNTKIKMLKNIQNAKKPNDADTARIYTDENGIPIEDNPNDDIPSDSKFTLEEIREKQKNIRKEDED
jgi:integrase